MLGGDVREMNVPIPQLLADEVVLDVDRLTSSTVVPIAGEEDGALIIIK